MARSGLTSKQEAFAQAVADGMSQADAYRAAYNTEKFKPEALWVNASKLMADARVSLRVAELRAALAEKALWKREDSVKILAEIAGAGEKDADRVRAVAELNKMHGFEAPQKVDHLNSDGSLRPTTITINALDGKIGA